MTSKLESAFAEAYVWVWLPDATQPVVAGLLSKQGQQLVFNYGRSYLARPDAIALYTPELPLQSGSIPLIPGLSMPSCLRDASPDAWGRRVLINRKLGMKGAETSEFELDELTYLLESGSDRIGALDFQLSAKFDSCLIVPGLLMELGKCMESFARIYMKAYSVGYRTLLNSEVNSATVFHRLHDFHEDVLTMDNAIKIIATDDAGNTTTKEMTIKTN